MSPVGLVFGPDSDFFRRQRNVRHSNKRSHDTIYGMDTLFTEMENERKSEVAPLAVRMRPRTLEEVVGQDEAVGPGSWLRNAIEQDQLSSVILFGPDSIYAVPYTHLTLPTNR